MIETITYYSTNEKVSREMAWLAFIVLPNGKLWDVRFSGATEEEAKQKAIELWESERAKVSQTPLEHKPCVKSAQPLPDSSWDEKPTPIDPWASEKQHHRAGKVWMRHKENRDLISIPLTEISMYESRGYERGGPRSK